MSGPEIGLCVAGPEVGLLSAAGPATGPGIGLPELSCLAGVIAWAAFGPAVGLSMSGPAVGPQILACPAGVVSGAGLYSPYLVNPRFVPHNCKSVENL